MVESEHIADQEKEADHRKYAEEQHGVDAFVGDSRNQQRNQQEQAQRIGEIDPPMLALRIEAVHELGELALDERPAGAHRATDRFREAVDATGAVPDRIDEQKPDRRPGQRGNDHGAEQGQQRIEHAAEQLRAQRGERADAGWRRLGCIERGAHIG